MIRRLHVFTAVSLFAFAAMSNGQEATLPTTPAAAGATGSTAPATLPARGGAAASADTPLMPDQQPSLVKPENASDTTAAKPEKKTKTEAFEQDLLLRVRFRQVETLALADKGVQAEWDNSVRARTDYVKREALAKYYNLLFARMAKIDPSLQKLIATKQVAALGRLKQTRITPTSPTDEAHRDSSGIIFVE